MMSESKLNLFSLKSGNIQTLHLTWIAFFISFFVLIKGVKGVGDKRELFTFIIDYHLSPTSLHLSL